MATSLSESSVGKRKSSIARVRFIKGNGKMIINSFEPIKYFKRKSLVMVVGQPLKVVDFNNKYDIFVRAGNYVSARFGDNFIRVSFSIPTPEVERFVDAFPKVMAELS